jgi:hypothetical protein
MKFLVALLISGTIVSASFANEDVQEIVVTAQPLSQMATNLEKCLAASCPPEADISATLAHAENQFVAGDYKGARRTLRESIDRNRQYRSRYPVALSELYRANANVLEHMGELTRLRHSIVEMRDTLKDNLPADDPRARIRGGACVSRKEQAKGRSHIRPNLRLTDFCAVHDAGDINSPAYRRESLVHSFTPLEQQASVQCKGDLAIRLCPLHRSPYKWQIKRFIRKRRFDPLLFQAITSKL